MLFGWSARSVLFLEAAKAPAEIRRMRSQLEDCVKLCGLGDAMTPIQQEIKDRSQFNLVCVQQLTMASKETQFKSCSDKFLEFLNNNHSRLIPSRVVEYCFNIMKRVKYR